MTWLSMHSEGNPNSPLFELAGNGSIHVSEVGDVIHNWIMYMCAVLIVLKCLDTEYVPRG